MSRIFLIFGLLLSSSISFGADFLCQGYRQSTFPAQIISFDLNKSETKKLAEFNGTTINVALDASNKDGKPYLSIESIKIDLLGNHSGQTAKGPIVKDMVVILINNDSYTARDISVSCSPF